MINPKEYRVLIVEDDTNERESLARLLTTEGYQISLAESVDQALSYLDESPDFIITDLQLGDLSGMDLLRHWKTKLPDTMFLMITGHGSTQTAVDAIKAGAYHYMTKPLDVQALLVMLQNMSRQREESRKVAMLQHRLDEKYGMSNIIGHSPRMERVFDLIRRSAQAFSTVLILGESGTGKELVAQAIHQNSPRRNGPFNAFNCAAMQPTLVESELFGHEKGAFTGAIERRMGRFEAAHGGTLFIDEIGDLDISLQVKLLRVLETRAITPVGGTQEIKVDTRVLAATSRDIRDMMERGLFREDLYYRLNVITVEMPPLRHRAEDIPLLVKRFMERVNSQNGTQLTHINPKVIDALQQYHWPGNVRELLNIVERMMVLSPRNSLEVEDLPDFIKQPRGSIVSTTNHGATNGNQGLSIGVNHSIGEHTMERNNAAELSGMETKLPGAPGANLESGVMGINENHRATLEQMLANSTLDELENMAIQVALQRHHNNRTRAARALGISVRTLQRKLGTKYGREGSEPVAPSSATHHNPPETARIEIPMSPNGDSMVGMGN